MLMQQLSESYQNISHTLNELALVESFESMMNKEINCIKKIIVRETLYRKSMGRQRVFLLRYTNECI